MIGNIISISTSRMAYEHILPDVQVTMLVYNRIGMAINSQEQLYFMNTG